MTISFFADKDHPPTPAELEAALGARYRLWESLTQFMAQSYALPGVLTFGGKNYGWNLWYRQGGKSLVSLYPQRAGPVAQVVLGGEQVEKALRLKLGQHVGQVLRETPQLHDGRWLFIGVKTEKDTRDVQQLIALKRRPNITTKDRLNK